MISIRDEQLLTLSQAARVRPIGRGGRPTHTSTVYRWISHGIRGTKLEAIRLGGSLYTSREALQRFADRLTSGHALPQQPTERTAIDEAEKEAGKLGL
jgi:Protein of unknown function (DUF1580)